MQAFIFTSDDMSLPTEASASESSIAVANGLLLLSVSVVNMLPITFDAAAAPVLSEAARSSGAAYSPVPTVRYSTQVDGPICVPQLLTR